MTGALRASVARNTQTESHYSELPEWQSSLCLTVPYLSCLARDLHPLSIVPPIQQTLQTCCSLTTVTSASPVSGFSLFLFQTAKWNVCYLKGDITLWIFQPPSMIRRWSQFKQCNYVAHLSKLIFECLSDLRITVSLPSESSLEVDFTFCLETPI